MMVEIAMKEHSAGRSYTLTCDGAGMSVSVCRSFVSVCFHNSAASLSRNLGGKVFHGASALDKASAAYKSGKARAMIGAVQQAERAILSAAQATASA